MALGGLFGYKANRLLVSGTSFANTVTALDQFRPGLLVSSSDLQPFTMTLNRFTASYVTSGPSRGQPLSFSAYMSYSAQPGGAIQHDNLRVNHPINVDGVRVFIIGHGYAPVFKVTDGTGKVVFNEPVPFIAVDTTGLTSEGVVKVPDAHPDQLGFAGVFLPTAVDVGGQLESAFPAPLAPRVSLVSYRGNLGEDSGPSQSVYQLNTAAPSCRSRPAHSRSGSRSSCQAGPARHLHRVPAVDQPGHHLRPWAAARADRGAGGAGRPAPALLRPAPPDVRPGLPWPGRADRRGCGRPGPLRPGWRLR